MRLIFIRHGDPDYIHDSLTEKGWREAEILSNRVAQWKGITQVFVSPLGRAQDTAALSLKKLGMEGSTLPWLEEIYFKVQSPDTGAIVGPWDWMPRVFSSHKDWSHREWWDVEPFKSAPDGKRRYENMAAGIDAVLSHYGYRRAQDTNEQITSSPVYYTDHTGATDKDVAVDDITLVFVCHFGMTAAIMSHLTGIPMIPLLQHFFCPTTSVTVMNSEEREPGTVAFRTQIMGDCRHLIEAGEPISASGYFTDVFNG